MTMQWLSLLSKSRFEKEGDEIVLMRKSSQQSAGDCLRSDFHIDHDRIVFSSAFRCLGRKTQVHPLAQHDHIHNRLTHSVEVASIGRSLGNQVGAMLGRVGELPEGFSAFDIGDLVQVACLGHDMGNPPFGHTGEEALRDWFRRPSNQIWLTPLKDSERRDVSTYEGNAHTFRILTSLEMYVGKGGMRLTAATLGTIVKYPWTTDAVPPGYREKFNLYGTELAYFEKVAQELELLKKSQHHWCRHPLSYLVEAADDLCYAILDLEDAVAIHILDAKDFEAILMRLAYKDSERLLRTSNLQQRCSMLRGIVMGYCVDEIAACFIKHRQALLDGSACLKDLIGLCSKPVRETLTEAKALANQHIYHHRSKLQMEIATFAGLGSLLDVVIPAVYTYMTQESQQCDLRQALILRLLQEQMTIDKTDSLYTAYMKALDYLGLMSDNAAADLAKTLSGLAIT